MENLEKIPFTVDDWEEEIHRTMFLVEEPEEIDQQFLRKVEAFGFEEAVQINELEDLLVRSTPDN